jgi:phage minor structural protein, N-terminal domain protein|nr:MAG TPA: Neck appendage protein [Caudoviricetes sp.]
MIYLQEGNFPLNEAFSSEIVQEANSTYQLTFKFPTSDQKWVLLTPETELVADDLHGEQYFTIFEVEKQHGYVTVYANQVATLLNGYSINKINVDRVNGATVMNALVAGFKRETPFTFFSDVMSKHTLNLKDISAMEALAKDKHSIVGQWGGDLVRDKYSVRLLENGGIENESLFAYKKNMKSFQESKSTKELRTRIHFKKVIEAHEEGKKDQILTVTIDSPLINKYKHIYEADMEVQDQDVVDQKTLEEYGKRYFRETLCDMIEESLEIDVVGQADQPVHMFDIVSIFHEGYDVDLRKKITKYKFNPMSIKLVSIGFGEVARTLADSISGMVNDSVDKKMKSYDAEYEAKVQKLVDNANAEYDKQAKELEHKITDGIEQAKAQAEVVKQEISAQVTEKINAANQANKNEIVEEFKAQYNGIEVKMQGLKATTDQLKTSDADIQKLINDFKAQTQSQFSGIQGAQSRFEQTTEKAISDLTNVANGKADRSYVEQTVNGIKEEFTTLKVGSRNYAEDYDFTRGLWFFAHGDSSDSTGTSENGVYTITGTTNTWKQAQLFSSTAPSWATKKTTALDYLEKGEPYTLSFYAKRNSGSGTMWASLRENRKSRGNPERISAHFQLTDDWQLYKVSVPALEKSDEFDFWRIIIGYSEAGSISFKKVELTQSTTRTDAGPAPEDQNYKIEQAQATFEKTVQGLSTQLTKLETKTGPNGELEQRMQTYSEKAAVDAVKATRQILEQGYVAKSQYTEDVAGINRKFESISTSTDSKISSKLAEFKQGVDGQFSTFSTEFGMKLSSQNSVLNDKLDDFKDSINGRFANYQQTVNGQITTIISQFDGVLKKTDINITDGQISFGTGKTINGRTISSLLVQEPEAIALIAQLIKVKGDMVVDGSITSRHLASQSVRTGHMESGSVTTQILASNAVTADKLQVDYALIQKLLANQAFIRELTSQKAFITQLASIDISAEHVKGGRLSANTGSTVFDLDNGTLNMYSNTGTIRRIDDTNSSQFIKLTKSGFIAEQFRDSNAALMVIGTNHNKDPKEVERHDNETFAGIRLWSGKGSGKEESLTEFVGDRVLIYNNGRYRSPWNFHGNANDGNAYLIPMNQNNVKHYIGRGDFFVEGIYSRHFYMSGGRDIGQYLWDLLTCFGIMKRYGQISGAAGSHVQGVLDKYGFR